MLYKYLITSSLLITASLCFGQSTEKTTVSKQTQEATFGEKVNAGLHTAGSAISQGTSINTEPQNSGTSFEQLAKTRHDTAKNAIGNVRVYEQSDEEPGSNTKKLKGTSKTTGDFNLANRFSLEIDGVVSGGVIKVEINEDAKTLTIIKVTAQDQTLRKWRQSVLDGKTDRRSISVIFLNDNQGIKRINIENAVLKNVSADEMSSRSSGHATEKLELAFTKIEYK